MRQPSTVAIAIDDAIIIEDKDQTNTDDKNNHVEANHQCAKCHGEQSEDGTEEKES